MQEGPVSKTDEVLVLLNRLAANPQDEPELSSNRASQRRDSASHLAVTVNTSPSGGFLHGIKTSLHKPWATAAELGNAIYGKPIQEESPKSSAIRVVLGEQTSSQHGRKLRRSTNSFKRKLFGQATGDAAEEVTEQTSEDSVRVHPLSAFRRYWDILVILLVIYTILVLPFRAAFYLDYYRGLEEHHNLLQQLQVDWMLATDIFVDLFFVGDIILNFNTGSIREQMVVMQRRAVTLRYLRKWFALDLVASFPLDLLFMGRRLDIWRLPRLLKIIRVLNNKSLARAFRDLMRQPMLSNISRFHIKILRLFLILLVWVHWDACLNYGFCAYEQLPRHCWVEANGLSDASIGEKYSWSVLKAVSETVSAGYGKQEPQDTRDCWVTILSLLMGVCTWTVMASIVTTLLIHMSAASSQYMVKIQEINSYMESRRLPLELRQRIRDTYEARWKAEKHFDEESILEELPGSLRIEDIVASVPFFEDAEEGFTTSLVTLLRPQVYLKGDVIIREGEVSREMYFIKSGTAQVELHGMPVTMLKAGSYFGEIGLLRDARRTATVRAVSPTLDLFVLTKEDFSEVMKGYTESFKAMDLVAEHRLRALWQSTAWQQKQQDVSPLTHLGSKIEHMLQEEDLAPDSLVPSGLMPDSLARDSLAQKQQALTTSTSAPPMDRFPSGRGGEPFEVSCSHAQLSSSARRRQSVDRGSGHRLSFHSSLRLSGQRGWSGAMWERGEERLPSQHEGEETWSRMGNDDVQQPLLASQSTPRPIHPPSKTLYNST